MQPWILLIVAGLLEAGWAVGLKYTDGLTKFWPTLMTAIALIISMLLLAIAMRNLPVGTAYPVWVGIGAFGTALYGMVFLGEAASLLRIGFLFLLLLSIAGLKATAAPSSEPNGTAPAETTQLETEHPNTESSEASHLERH